MNSAIAMGVRGPEFENPTNALARIMQVQGMQQDSAMRRMQMDDYQRGQQENKLLNTLYGEAMKPDGSLDRGAFLGRVAQSGLGSKIPTLQKTFAEADKATADVGKTRAETDAKRIEEAGKRAELVGRTFKFLMDNPTPENAQSVLNFSQEWMPAQQVEQMRAMLAQDPSRIGQFAQFMVRQSMAVKDQLPAYETRNLGGTTDTLQRDPVTGAVKVVNSARNTISPDAQLQATTSTENNKRTVNASYANANAVRETANATRDAARIKANQDVEMKLGDDYRTQSKNFKEVSDAYRTINATLDKATTSPAATLAGATKFMKLLDPGSVVRESELGMALAATGVFDRATNYFNTLRSGKVLTASQVADFKNITGQIYSAAQQGQQQVDAHYRQQAKTYGLRPEMIVQDLGQGGGAPAAATGVPSASAIDAELARRAGKGK